ncbi:MAG: MATE family efflux transporter [Mogibacterium sp.]|nr:MATE family efflux transporter [Mogibacterium sp.]
MSNSKWLPGSKRNLDMTEGNIGRLLITFSVPLLLGNVFQQLYNMVDAWVVGNFVSNEAFSAVGTVGPILNTLISLFLGLSSGAGVVISQNYGAKREEAASKAIHTAIVMTFIIAIFLTTAGILLRDVFLRMMNTPENVIPEARLYLLILFAGMAGMMFYNIGAAALQALGDSTRPFYFLTTATVINIVGDLVLVLVFHRGVEGVAIATVTAMTTSAVLVMITLFRTETCLRLSLRKMRIDTGSMKQIIRIGIPAALQMGIISFSNIIVQGYINYFGADVMSGWTAYNKIDALMLLPMQSLALATTTFVGQNIGFGRVQRARDGVREATRISVAITFALSIPVMVFAPALVGFFNSKPEVVAFGTQILRWMTPFYVITCAANVTNSGLRGAGDSKAPMLITIFSYVVFRQIYLASVTHFMPDNLIIVCLGYPFGWILCTIISSIYFRRTNLGGQSVTGGGTKS